MDNRSSIASYAWRVVASLRPVIGLREFGNGVNALRRASVRAMTVSPEFDLERWHDDNLSTRSATVDARRPPNLNGTPVSTDGTRLEKPADPFDDAFAVPADRDEDRLDPFHHSHVVAPEAARVPEARQPYHVFSQKRKWFLIIIIGIAGMFSGLSSNIYFPSLDAIARVGCPPIQVPVHIVTSDSSLGSPRQPERGVFDRHVLPNHPGHLAGDMGLTLRRTRTKTHLYSLLLGLHLCQCRTQLLSQLCCVACIQRSTSSW